MQSVEISPQVLVEGKVAWDFCRGRGGNPMVEARNEWQIFSGATHNPTFFTRQHLTTSILETNVINVDKQPHPPSSQKQVALSCATDSGYGTPLP